MSNKEYFYITTPIYYVNDIPHIGHFYTTIACDVIARYKRLKKSKVIFTTGTDEHGIKIENKAKSLNIEPIELVNKLRESFIELFKISEITNTSFIYTSNKIHKENVSKVWNLLYKNNYIYKGDYEGYYSISDEAFYGKSEIYTSNDSKLRAISSDSEVSLLKEESYFFKLSIFQDKLLNFYNKNPDFVQPKEKFNEVKSFVKSGLKDLSISRLNVKWGIKVPNDCNHTIYVWLDALSSYLTGVNYFSENTENNNPSFNKIWPPDLHMIGKDILKFHAVYWPAFLMALDLPLPKKIFAHGWWTNNKQKISKSLGNTINPLDLINSYGLDEIKYFLLKEIPFGNDGDFNTLSIIKRINSELVNEYGNLCQRSYSLVYNNLLNKCVVYQENNSTLNNFQLSIKNFLNESEDLIDQQSFNIYLEKLWIIIRNLNSYINEIAPWNLIKENKIPEANNCLYTVINTIKDISLILLPIIPNIATKALKQINYDNKKFNLDYVGKFEPSYNISIKPFPIVKKVDINTQNK